MEYKKHADWLIEELEKLNELGLSEEANHTIHPYIIDETINFITKFQSILLS